MIMCRQEHAQAIDKAVFPGLQGGPHEHCIAAKAVAFHEALQPEFRNYASQIVRNAKELANTLIEKGFRLVSGGTDNHLILVDLTSKNVTGKDAETALDKAGITVNKNTIPYDPKPPFNPSGIRIGTPTLTTRGMKESEMRYVGELISKAIDHVNDNIELEKIREEVKELCRDFPVY
jgi:glycine hydroxymethyltransferase